MAKELVNLQKNNTKSFISIFLIIMKIFTKLVSVFLLVAIGSLFFFSCAEKEKCTPMVSFLETALQQAGENRVELEKVLSCRRIFTIHSIYSFNIGIMAREQEKLSKDVLAVLDKKTNDLRLVSEMNEQTGEFNTVSTAPGDRRRALSFDSRTVLGTFFENLRNQYGRPSDLG